MVGGGDRHKIKVINRSVNACVSVNKDQKISLFRTEETVPSFAPYSTKELLPEVVGSVKHKSKFYLPATKFCPRVQGCAGGMCTRPGNRGPYNVLGWHSTHLLRMLNWRGGRFIMCTGIYIPVSGVISRDTFSLERHKSTVSYRNVGIPTNAIWILWRTRLIQYIRGLWLAILC